MGNLVMDLKFLEAMNGEKNWWTGGTDLGLEGEWYWIRSRETVGDYVWYSSEPDQLETYNCLLLQYGYGYLGFDQPCTSAYYPICQIKTAPTPPTTTTTTTPIPTTTTTTPPPTAPPTSPP